MTLDLNDLCERHVGAAPAERAGTFRSLRTGLTQAIEVGAADAAADVLRRVVAPALDYTSAQSLSRIQSALQNRGVRSPQQTRLAVLGSFTTTQLVPLIRLHLFAAGIDAEVYEADYGVFRQEVLDPQSALYEFGPQIVYLATSWRDLVRRPDMNGDREDLDRVVATEQAEWHALWKTLQDRAGCQVIQNNCVLPPCRSFANHEMRQPGSLNRYLAATNQHLMETAPPFVTIHDVDHLAAVWGRWNWDDPRFVHQAKMPCSPEYLVDYAHSVASLVAAQLGLAKKCLVLDLDNTLWGGVIGDDGLGGIRLGQGDPEGEAYLAFQHYVKSLQERGVILAVCSKNNDATAREVFDRHSEMVLRQKDISCFVANWDDKATNLQTIAATLNIGVNSLVFVDDNPAERAIVRRLVPQVAVPELPEDVAGYAQVLEQHRYFQVLSVGAEDFQRTEFYRSDTMRKAAEASAGDIEEYLRSLEMIARVGPIDSSTLERSVQLIGRSNQFNLTTRRRSAAEIMALLDDETWITRTVSLADRFGDNGLISVLLARVSGQAIEIDTWLMSCRVLKRGVEQFLLNHLVDVARARGISRLRGEYIPTLKNTLVREHYAGLGFARGPTRDDDRTTWELILSDGWRPLQTTITEMSSDGND
jgi:FkbH-like protein